MELDARDELPDEQREVFVAHESMGYSFKEIAAQTGVSMNTLLSRKHYEVSLARPPQRRNALRIFTGQTILVDGGLHKGL